jgi:hypothetical protein
MRKGICRRAIAPNAAQARESGRSTNFARIGVHKGRREKFVALVDRYFSRGTAKLIENRRCIQLRTSRIK